MLFFKVRIVILPLAGLHEEIKKGLAYYANPFYLFIWEY